MKQSLLILLGVLLSLNIAYSQNSKDISLNIGVISDLHFLSESLMDGGPAIQEYVKASGKDVIDVPEVLDQVINKYLNSNIDVLLISGDMTKDGEKQSHLDLVQKLKPLINKGVRIFVIPGNHDINVPQPLGYKDQGTFIVDNTSVSDFVKIYDDFGYKSALYRDTSSLSYINELDSNTWLLALDGCLYKQYKDRTISAGKLSENTLEWIKNVLKDAKTKNKRVIAMMHHGLVEHFPEQSNLFKDYLISDNKSIATLLADQGIQIIFTGHFHANDITEFISNNGNNIYDIETGALCAYPFAYRFINLSKEKIIVKTENITATKSNPKLVEESKLNIEQQVKSRVINKLGSFGLNIDKNLRNNIAQIISNIFLQHLAGDETMDDNLYNSINYLNNSIGTPYDLSDKKIEIDFYPADNNIELDLKSY